VLFVGPLLSASLSNAPLDHMMGVPWPEPDPKSRVEGGDAEVSRHTAPRQASVHNVRFSPSVNPGCGVPDWVN